MSSHNASKPIRIMLPRAQEKAFVEGIQRAPSTVYKALAKIDSRKAAAREQADKRKIDELVAGSVTHSRLNQMANKHLREWRVQTGLKQERELRGQAKDDSAKKRLADFQYALSWMLRDLGNLKEGERAARECLDFRERALGAKHPRTLNAVNNLTSLLQARGKLDEAEPLFQRYRAAKQ